MKSVIYKYEIPWRQMSSEGIVVVDMHKVYQILHLGVQWSEKATKDRICLWAMIDPNPATIRPQRFFIVGTGQKFENTPDREYIGTVQVDWLVLHVFKEHMRYD